MTELTAAQVIGRLRTDLFDAVPDDNDMQHILSITAALLEQQAEQIAGLTAQRDEAWRERSDMLDKAMRRAVRNDRARALAARHRYGAERWADPLPVPEWVIELEGILDDYPGTGPRADDAKTEAI